MIILKWLYEKVKRKPAPYYYNYSLWALFMKPIRKFFTNAIAPLCPFNFIRIAIYRMCGFKIGKHVFIGMHCYLDDMCYDLMTIGNWTGTNLHKWRKVLSYSLRSLERETQWQT